MPKDWVYPPCLTTELGKTYTTDLAFPRVQVANDDALARGGTGPLARRAASSI